MISSPLASPDPLGDAARAAYAQHCKVRGVTPLRWEGLRPDAQLGWIDIAAAAVKAYNRTNDDMRYRTL